MPDGLGGIIRAAVRRVNASRLMIRPVKVIGLMSGTSADGVDAALVEWPDGAAVKPFRLLGYRETPFSGALQQRIHRIAAGRVPGPEALAELASLDVLLGEQFASAAAEVARSAGVPLSAVDAIASHGQTVAHHPELRATLQIGDPSVIAERTGCATVADFRPRDMAAGGEGAPLAPFFHYAAFSHEREGRVVLNLGGIANITWLRRDATAEDVIAFDVGPANSLIDGVVATLSGGAERMDRDGLRARKGTVAADLLERLLDDEFLRRTPPKSTGRERYGLAEAERLAKEWVGAGRSADDLVATLVAFSAEAVALAARTFLDGSPIDRLLVGGGGSRNPELIRALAARFPRIPVEPFDAAGVPADAAEAMAFSLMGRNALLGIPNSLPRCTGARERGAVLGEIVPGGPGLRIRA
jgi:anhydro-N-acetylmuramic acid kinase